MLHIPYQLQADRKKEGNIPQVSWKQLKKRNEQLNNEGEANKEGDSLHTLATKAPASAPQL